jgi:chitinase
VVSLATTPSVPVSAIQLWTCNGTNAQQWTHAGNTFQALRKCMDVWRGGTANGTAVQLWDCNEPLGR